MLSYCIKCLWVCNELHCWIRSIPQIPSCHNDCFSPSHLISDSSPGLTYFHTYLFFKEVEKLVQARLCNLHITSFTEIYLKCIIFEYYFNTCQLCWSVCQHNWIITSCYCVALCSFFVTNKFDLIWFDLKYWLKTREQTFSLPARSTRYNLPLSFFCVSMFSCLTLMRKTEWLRDECSFMSTAITSHSSIHSK